MKTILISQPDVFLGEAELINQILALEKFNFHLRKKEVEEKELKKLILKINPEFYSRIILHQHYNLEKEFKLGGIHLPEAERINFEELKTKGHNIISTSIHFLKDFNELRRQYHYVIFAPLFTSISKENHQPIYSTEVLTTSLKEINNKSNLFALGGITDKNLKDVYTYGFAGAGLLGHVWTNKNPVKTFQEFLKLANEEFK